MGIPRLTAKLRPYSHCSAFSATPATFPLDAHCPGSDQRACEVAVVDGPALAYFAYSRALALRGSARNALEAAPSYDEVGRIAVAWLLMLQLHGFVVEAVFFDGALPADKRPVRIDRLEGCLRQLTAFRALHASNILVAPSRPPLDDADVHGFAAALPVPAKAKSLPPPAFMVPAVIEALQESRFAGITRVVSAEADMFCARQAALGKKWVFTGDSDLLVYDLHPGSAVVFLHDVELSSSDKDQKDSILNVTHYLPQEIAERLGLRSLLPFAYAVYKDTHRSFSATVQAAKNQIHSEAFERFKQCYAVPASQLDGNDVHGQGLGNCSLDDAICTRALHKLDPRLSELLQQARQRSERSDGLATLADEHESFLPFLIDDPARASAWQAGREVRRVAYKLLVCAFAHRNMNAPAAVTEYERRGSRIAQAPLELPNSAALIELCGSLVAVLGLWIPPGTEDPRPASWRAAGLHLLLQPLVAEGKPLPSEADVTNLVCGIGTGTTWNYMHFSAQLQAVLHSLRMLQQVLSLMNLSESQQGKPQDVVTATEQLQRCAIPFLPKLKVLFPGAPADSQRLGDTRAACRSVVAKLLDLLGSRSSPQKTDNLAIVPSKKKRKSKKPKSGNAESGGASIPRFASANAFGSLLAE